MEQKLGNGRNPGSAEDKMGLFHGRTEGGGALETQGFNSTEIKLSPESHPPVGPQEMFVPRAP